MAKTRPWLVALVTNLALVPVNVLFKIFGLKSKPVGRNSSKPSSLAKSNMNKISHFQGETFSHQKISGTDFTNIDLKFSSFNHCQFFSCNFSQANFNATLFSDSHFTDSCFSGVDFSALNLKKCIFTNTLINLATFQQIKNNFGHELIKFSLNKIIFENCDLTESLFHFCQLVESKFINCNLYQTVFKKSDLTKADLSGSQLQGTIFSESILHQTKLDLNGLIQFGQSQGFILNQ